MGYTLRRFHTGSIAFSRRCQRFSRPDGPSGEDAHGGLTSPIVSTNRPTQVGQLKVELDWLKKKLDRSLDVKRGVIEPDHPQISIARPCDVVGLPRSS